VSRAESEIAKQRARLLKIERNGMSEIVRSYQKVLKDLNRRLAALTAQIEAEREAGHEVSQWWLQRQERFRDLIAQQEKLTLGFLRDSLTQLEGMKGKAIAQANGDAPELTQAVLGSAPARAEALVANSFSRLPTSQLEHLVRNAADGRPLGSLFAEIAPEATKAVKDALVSGVARGAGVKVIAADVRKAAGIAQNRAMLITRTEVIRAYRETAFENYRRSEVVTGWIWIAEVNGCPVCTAEHGSEHSTEESLDSHPGCRCTAMPKTKSWRELGYDLPDTRPQITPGPERFAALPQADRLAILGRSRFEAYERGEVTLEEMVRPTHSPRWGEGKRVATLAELGVG
jgi:SPP1 gp7 family putative phage head morphogenesis protein